MQTAAPPSVDVTRARALLGRLRADTRLTLLEPDARDLLDAAGIRVPAALFVPVDGDPPSAEAIASLRSDRVVVKVVSRSVAHKTEVGGVAMVAADRAVVADAIDWMRARIATSVPVDGFSVAAFIPHEASPGGELLVGLRWTDDVGPVVTVGLGGVQAELLAGDLRASRATAILSPAITPRSRLRELLLETTAVRLSTQSQRGRPPLVPLDAVADVVERFLDLAELCAPNGLLDLEVNPFAVTAGGLVALDVLATLGPAVAPLVSPDRPVWKLPRLLEPRSIAIVGVSSGDNPGRTILRNMLRDGFDPARIEVVKPGATEIEGCRCVPDIASLAAKVDLFVVAVSATVAAGVVAEIAELDAAESVIVIPGGLEEKAGAEALVGRMRMALASARGRAGGGPLINGGNCLGIRSLPGRYDTLFIPGTKLAPPGNGNRRVPLAIVAQSGAFAISRLDRLAGLDPTYVITVGNQMDLTIGDHLAHLADDPSIAVAAVYVEGFAPLDASRFLAAARRMTAAGRAVILYRGGRTRAGATASASHTAAIAGDVAVTTELARQAGVVVAATLAEFDDLVRAFTLLHDRTIGGSRLAAVSNAGFECVAIADALDGVRLVPFTGPTAAAIGEVLADTGIDRIVDLHDPLDLTPAADDAAFARVVEAVLASEDVDVAVVGNVPFTAEMQTLSPGPDHDEDLAGPESVGSRLIELWRSSSKAWVCVIDAGPRYDALARYLEAAGIPTFRTADAALRALGSVVRTRLGGLAPRR